MTSYIAQLADVVCSPMNLRHDGYYVLVYVQVSCKVERRNDMYCEQ